MRSAKQPFWWRTELDETVCDPITLEPIREFASEPFKLGKTYFDAEMLAHYLISTSTFAHPTTRERITREDCLRLDAHLHKKSRVTEAFDLLTNLGNANKRQSLQMQREAAAIFQQLFVFRSRRDDRNRRPNRRPTSSLGGGGLTVVDDDEERFTNQQQQQQDMLAFDLQRDFPDLFPQNGPNSGESRQSVTRKLAPAKPRGGGQIQGRIHQVVASNEVLPTESARVEAVETDVAAVVEEEEEEEERIPSPQPRDDNTGRLEEQLRNELRAAKRAQNKQPVIVKARKPKPAVAPQLPPPPPPIIVIKQHVAEVKRPSPDSRHHRFTLLHGLVLAVLAIAILVSLHGNT